MLIVAGGNPQPQGALAIPESTVHTVTQCMLQYDSGMTQGRNVYKGHLTSDDR